MAPGLQTQCEGSLLIVAEWTINDLFRSGKLQDEEGAVSSESLICAKLIFPINCHGRLRRANLIHKSEVMRNA
jgi:hypothetical protein